MGLAWLCNTRAGQPEHGIGAVAGERTAAAGAAVVERIGEQEPGRTEAVAGQEPARTEAVGEPHGRYRPVPGKRDRSSGDRTDHPRSPRCSSGEQ